MAPDGGATRPAEQRAGHAASTEFAEPLQERGGRRTAASEAPAGGQESVGGAGARMRQAAGRQGEAERGSTSGAASEPAPSGTTSWARDSDSSASSSSSSSSSSSAAGSGASSSDRGSTAEMGAGGPAGRAAQRLISGAAQGLKAAVDSLRRAGEGGALSALQRGAAFLQEELSASSPRRKRASRSPAPPTTDARSDATSLVTIKRKLTPWQQRWEDLLEKARQSPIFKRFSGLKQHPVVTKSQEIAEDLRDRWETSDSAVVHKFQDLNESLFGETATALAMREIKRRDPLFSLPEFVQEVQADVRPVLKAYLKGDTEVLREKCSREVVERCIAERKALEAQGLYLDNRILHISDMEVKETKLLGNEPIIIVAFQTQQIYCARDKSGAIREGGKDEIHTVFYAWAMQQAYDDVEPREEPRWRLREMQQLGMQAII
eukprot:SM000200S05838  [mRNA]  locus=s200:184475:187387:- [translate_table: standard]